ncbi:unnamed protein product [Thlaspi arvense]|uniref:Uncharacterized protein n=1 Tax=Thlaspi arvense TaxID=13288 RepID=A0AAU9RPG7_THLAR|nr:unnamed protein product [Thlaspi arvense]
MADLLIRALRQSLMILPPPHSDKEPDEFTWGEEGARTDSFSSRKTWDLLRLLAPPAAWTGSDMRKKETVVSTMALLFPIALSSSQLIAQFGTHSLLDFIAKVVKVCFLNVLPTPKTLLVWNPVGAQKNTCITGTLFTVGEHCSNNDVSGFGSNTIRVSDYC